MSWAKEICFFRYWYTLPRARNLKLTFEFQTPLARNYPTGTSELIPFDANSGLRRNFKLRRSCPSGTSELLPFGANLDISWDWKFPEIPSWGFLFDFADTSELFSFGANSDLHWNCTAGALELISFCASSYIPWDLRFPGIPYRGFLFAFPCWCLLFLSVFG